MENALHFLNVQYIFYLIYTLFFGWTGNGGVSGAVGPVGGGAGGATGSAAGTGSSLGTAAGAAGASFLGAIGAILASVWAGISFISFVISALLIAGTLYAIFGIMLIRQKEEALYSTIRAAHIDALEEDRRSVLLTMAGSDDPKAWRDAIVGADQLLREMLMALGYVADTVDEQLRAVPENAFSTLPAAWEAHRAKNIIESDTGDFILTKSETVRIMHLYISVFEEHNFA